MTLEKRAADALALLRRISEQHAPVVLASSFSAEDMVLTDLIGRHALVIGICTLDTGRLPGDTYALIDRVRDHYGLPIDVYYPDAHALERYVGSHGVNAFYRSVELRQGCCAIRKTEPLKRALARKRAWITGQRRAQSLTRNALQIEEFDEVHRLAKFNPIAEWGDEDVWAYLRGHGVPYNAMHDRGYPSIGCEPCTRAVQAGEDIRAGRWWWEQPEHRECGLHRRPIPVRIEQQGAPA